MLFRFSKILMNAAGDGGGGGAGGGGGGTGGEGGAVAFTDDQKAEMVRIQNAAISAHHTRMQKVMDQKLEEVKEQMLGTLNETLEKITKAAGGGNGTSNGKKKSGEASGELDQIRQEYEARIAEIEKRAAKAESDQKTERENAQRTEERSKLTAALQAANVPQGLVRAAAALLYVEDKRIGRDRDGKVVFKAQREGYVEDLDLAAGIEEWLKSAEGKYYAPARDVRGSGAEGGRMSGQASGQKQTLQEKKRELARAILAAERGIG